MTVGDLLEDAGTELMTASQLRSSLGISGPTFRRYIREGILPPPVNPGSSKHLFRPEAVRAYLRRRERLVICQAGRR